MVINSYGVILMNLTNLIVILGQVDTVVTKFCEAYLKDHNFNSALSESGISKLLGGLLNGNTKEKNGDEVSGLLQKDSSTSNQLL